MQDHRSETNKRPMPWWLKFGLALVPLILGVLVILYVLDAGAGRDWAALAAKIRASGQPLSLKEVAASMTPLPDDENSARVIEALPADAPPAPAQDDDILVFNGRTGDFFQGIASDSIAPSRAYVELNRPMLEAMRALRDKPHGRYTADLDPAAISSLLPVVSRARHAAKLLRLEAVVLLLDRRLEDAAEVAHLQVRMAGTFDGDPMLIAQLVAWASDRYALRTIEDLLRVGEVDDSALRGLADVLREGGLGPAFRMALLRERAVTADAQLLGGLHGSTARNVSTGTFIPAFLLQRDRILAVSMISRLIDAVDEPAELHRVAKALDAEVAALGAWATFAKIQIPSLTSTVETFLWNNAERDCAIAALAAERFRLAQGSFPSDLADLVPAYLSEVPIDPFSGGALKLAQTDLGVVVYSVGRDGVDGGGEVADVRQYAPDGSPLPGRRPPDMGFRLLMPAHRGVVITPADVAEPAGE
jgi:hypothetical protein